MEAASPKTQNRHFGVELGVPVRADVAARFNGIEQALAWVSVAFMDDALLSLAWTALRLRSQLMEVARQQKTA